MSLPEGHKDLWKNVDWKDLETKLAFYNKYFKESSMERDRILSAVKSFKVKILAFIEHGEIMEGKQKRKITIKDIENRIKE